MLANRIIAALDIDKGRVVKGVNFKDIKDAGDPLELAKRYEEEGVDELVFLDITASHEKRDILGELVEQVAEEIFVPFTVGGGIRSVEDIRETVKRGADKVFVNTAAVETPYLIEDAARLVGSANLVVAIDAKWEEELDGWRVYTHGGREPREWEVRDWAREMEKRGAGEILLTSMDTDGTKDGFDIPLTRAVTEAVDIPVIASGGAGETDHFLEVFQAGASAALAASIFHYGEYGIDELKTKLIERGANVRKAR